MSKRKEAFMARTERVCFRALAGVLALVFLVLFIFCLAAGYRLYEDRSGNYPYFVWDIIPLNLLGMAMAALCFWLLYKLKLSVKTAEIWTLGLTALLGCAFVLVMRASPRWDAMMCRRIAQQALKGDAESILGYGYICAYPFQSGYVLYRMLLEILFGEGSNLACALLNVGFLVLMYGAVIRTARMSGLFSADDRKAWFTLFGLLLSCLQTLTYTTFQYGNLPAFALAMWALTEAAQWVRKKRPHSAVLSCLLLCVACQYKQSVMIFAIALCILLLIRAAKDRKGRIGSVVLAVCLVVMPLLAQSLAQRSFEAIIGAPLDPNTRVPLTAHLVMGLQDSDRMAGWYNGYTGLEEFKPFTAEENHARVMADLRAQTGKMLQSPLTTLKFFWRKITSTWGETTFSTLQLNRDSTSFGNLPDSVRYCFTGKRAKVISLWMESWTLMLYAGFTACCARLCLRSWPRRDLVSAEGQPRESRFPLFALLLTVFGGFLYFALFESKSEYIFTFLPIMAVPAVYGLRVLAEYAGKALARLKKKRG